MQAETADDPGSVLRASPADGLGQLRARLRREYPSLAAAERRVADTITSEPGILAELPLKLLAERCGVSEATVVRFCQALGYEGLRGLKRELAATALSPARLSRPVLEAGDPVSVITRRVIQSDISVLTDTLSLLDWEEVENAVEALLAASRIECYAIGSSLPIAMDAYYRLLRLGLPVTIVTDPHMQSTSAAHLPSGSVAFGISHRGRSAETEAAFRWAKHAGARCLLLTSFPRTPLARLADIRLLCAVPDSSLRPEAVATRIAHLAVVDALSVAIALRRPEASADALLQDDAIIAEREIPE